MKKYEVYVNERNYGTVNVDAESPEEALQLAEDGFIDGDTIWNKCNYRLFIPEETKNAGNNEVEFATLEEILRNVFSCKKPFLKKRKIVGRWSNGEPDYEYLTKIGGKAYGKLVELVYALGRLLDNSFDANHYVAILDRIVNEDA
jgi:hypothetical protein